MVMMARPAYASQTVDTSGTHLSCVMSPHSATPKQVCMQVSNTPPSVAKEPIQIAQAQINNPKELEFSDDGIDAIANMATEVNSTVENIGARRLHTIIERILEDISFTATDRAGEKIIINSEYVKQNLDELVKDTDLSKFIL